MTFGEVDMHKALKERIFSLRYIAKYHYGALPLIVLMTFDTLWCAGICSYMFITRDYQPTKGTAPFHMRMSLLDPIKLKLFKNWVTVDPNQELHDIYEHMNEKDKERKQKIAEFAKSN